MQSSYKTKIKFEKFEIALKKNLKKRKEFINKLNNKRKKNVGIIR